MSHTVTVELIADQSIFIGGKYVNIHDIETIFVSEDGKIENFTLKTKKNVLKYYEWDKIRNKWIESDRET